MSGQDEQNSSLRLYLTGLKHTISWRQLQSTLMVFGSLKSLFLSRSGGRRRRRFAFVQFADLDTALLVLRIGAIVVGDGIVYVFRAAPRRNAARRRRERETAAQNPPPARERRQNDQQAPVVDSQMDDQEDDFTPQLEPRGQPNQPPQGSQQGNVVQRSVQNDTVSSSAQPSRSHSQGSLGVALPEEFRMVKRPEDASWFDALGIPRSVTRAGASDDEITIEFAVNSPPRTAPGEGSRLLYRLRPFGTRRDQCVWNDINVLEQQLAQGTLVRGIL